MAIAAVILMCQDAGVIKGEELPSVGMAAQDKINVGLRFLIIFNRLMIQNNLVQIRIQPIC